MVTKTVVVERPTVMEYAYLNSNYSESLRCPCSKISISYDKFLHVDYTLHQVCSSIFVHPDWITYLQNSLKFRNYYPKDFGSTGIYAFQALRTFCDLINRSISDQLIQFYSNQYVTASVVPQRLFESETETLTNQFRSSLTNNFLLSFSMIRDTIQSNAFFSALQSNYLLYVGNIGRKAATRPESYNDCSCSFSFECISQSSIIHYESKTSLFDVPGFYTGCFVVDSLLQSTLECFYHQRCIDELKSNLSSLSSINLAALDASLSNYSENSTIKKLVDNLMIEQWSVSHIFKNYYNECQPIQCTYTLETNNDVIYIFTTLFGIAGGLTTVLRLILPRLIGLIRRKQRQQQVITGE